MAKLYFTHGTMGAQKTTQLLAAAHNFEEHGGRVLITKPAMDTKGDRDLVSRIGLRREVDFLTTPSAMRLRNSLSLSSGGEDASSIASRARICPSTVVSPSMSRRLVMKSCIPQFVFRQGYDTCTPGALLVALYWA